MSATRNTDAASNSQGVSGQFSSSVPRSEPLTTSGHKPGVLATDADKAPEFHAKTIPAGSAPADRTFKPDASNEAPIDSSTERTSASDTIGGATSADVHTGLGHPGQGQSSNELRHDGGKGKTTGGLEGTGASGVPAANLVDGSDTAFAKQNRAIDNEDAVIGRGSVGGAAAEDRIPEQAK